MVKSSCEGEMVGYHFDKWTHTWLVENFIAQSHNCPGFIGKVFLLTNSFLEPGCADYSYLDQGVDDLKQSLDFILTDSVHMLELDGIASSVSSGLLSFVVLFLIIIDCSLLLVLNFIYYGALLQL